VKINGVWLNPFLQNEIKYSSFSLKFIFLFLILSYYSLRHGLAAASLLGLRVRIPPREWMCVCCECCVLLGRDPCDEPITLPEKSYRVWCV
jgi:hypothetical protein